MLIIFIGAFVCFAILLIAVKIILGWFYKPAAEGFARAVEASGRAMFQLSVVLLACFIVWAIYHAATTP